MHQYSDIIKQATYTAKLSKMLAQENIAVEFDSEATTASFHPENRVLTLPYSTPLLDSDIQEAFMFHEVSHAINLPANSIQMVKDADVDHGIFNIVVDIRDERLIKKQYPGCIKTMQIAYEKLLDQGFFGKVDEIPFRQFADRLNVYAKCGMVTGRFIPMSTKEHAFYDKCMKAETFDELLELSRELEELNKNSIDIKGFITKMREAFFEEETELSEKEKNELIAEELEKLKQQTVQDIFDGTIAASCLKNAMVVSYETFPLKDVNIISAKQYSQYVKEYASRTWNITNDATITSSVREMRKSISQSVDSMVRVFETKKAADRYKNIKVSETGSIDINKVYRYQFDDKIFRQTKVMPNSKNHGYYILVDLSGSMSMMLQDVIEQIVVITEFFRRIQVPYKVVGFGMSGTNSLSQSGVKKYHKHINQEVINPMPTILRSCATHETLIEFMTNTQTTLEHNMALVGLIDSIGWNLGSTPTGFAVAASEQYAVNFFKQSGTTSNHMIVMTDGSPTDLVANAWDNRGKTIIVTDKQTKKVVTAQGNADYAMVNCIGKVFENRHGIQFTTISMMKTLNEYGTHPFVSSRITDEMKSEWRKKGYTKLIDPNTKNEVLVAKPFAVDTEVGDIAGDLAEKSSALIARAMLKNMKKVKKSRNFLNALAEKLS